MKTLCAVCKQRPATAQALLFPDDPQRAFDIAPGLKAALVFPVCGYCLDNLDLAQVEERLLKEWKQQAIHEVFRFGPAGMKRTYTGPGLN